MASLLLSTLLLETLSGPIDLLLARADKTDLRPFLLDKLSLSDAEEYQVNDRGDVLIVTAAEFIDWLDMVIEGFETRKIAKIFHTVTGHYGLKINGEVIDYSFSQMTLTHMAIREGVRYEDIFVV